jgi:hypothetical protein
MSITYIVSSRDNLKILATLTYFYRLFLQKGLIIHILQRIMSEKDRHINSSFTWTRNKIKYKRPKYIIAIAFIDNVPVGVVTINGFYTNIYIKKIHRRQGIATELFKQISSKYELSHIMNLGTSREARAFQNKIKLPIKIKQLKNNIELG